MDSFSAGIPLSRYTALISNTVAMSPHLAGVWVMAELSDVRVSGGHCYLELIEKNEAGQTVAKLRGNIWNSAYIRLRKKFYEATQRDITTGIKALVRGSATHHSIYGLSFNIMDIDPSYTLGDMERLRREILMKLQSEGVALYNKSLPIPEAPQKIAVISAEGAAGYGDFINQLTLNSEGFVFYPKLFPCVMQGDRVSESIRNALLVIESTAHLWDCVVIVRGGGATTDLNGFDDYQLARAVATCGLPVVVGIGHERDRNVLDEIANTSLKTPTAVAAFFVDKMRVAYDKVLLLADRLRVYSNELMRGEERRLSSLQSIMPQLALHCVETANVRLNNIASKIPLLIAKRIQGQNSKLDSMTAILPNYIKNRVDKEKLRIENLTTLIGNYSSHCIEKGKRQLDKVAALVDVLDPKNTLARGYSISRIDGKTVKSIENIKQGDIIITTLHDGEIKSMAMEESEN